MNKILYLVTFVAAVCITTSVRAEGTNDDKAIIEKAIETYTAAFNAHDAKKLSEHWLPDAVYTNQFSGVQVTGREAIEKEFGAILAELKDTKLAVEVESIEFISPSVAMERGIAKLISKENEVNESSYSAIHVKRDGKWFLDRVTEEEIPIVVSHYEQLKDLEWMIGTWKDQTDGSQIETTSQWTRNNNYILRSFKVIVDDSIDSSGIQVIGWDPATRRIRSWAFDSNGGFAEGTWSKKDKSWIVESKTTLPDGQRGSSINIMTIVDNDTLSWQATGREVSGNILPSTDKIKVTRVKK